MILKMKRFVSSRLVLASLIVYFISRVFTAGIILWLAKIQDFNFYVGALDTDRPPVTYFDMTRIWDGLWYNKIVQYGYPHFLPLDSQTGLVLQNPLAFFPAYPYLVKGVMAVTGLSFAIAAPTVSLILGFIAIALMLILLKPLVGSKGTFCVIAVFSFLPMTPVLQMAYTEALALVFLLAFFIVLRKQWWAWAGLLAIMVGLTRAIAAPLFIVALVAIFLRVKQRNEKPIKNLEWLLMSFMVGCTLIGAVIWPYLAGVISGNPKAYGLTQSSWRDHTGVTFFKPWYTNFYFYFGNWWFVPVVFIFATIIISTVGPWAKGMGPILKTWVLAYSVYLLGTVYVSSSTFRYAIFLFPLIIPWIGVGVPVSERVLVKTRTVAFVLLGMGWQLWWCWSFMHIAYYPHLPV